MKRTSRQPGLFQTTGGTSLHYETDGSGPPVVMIPGFTLDTRMWEDQAAALRDMFTVIRYDLPGSGRSPPPMAAYSYEDDLADLLDHLGVARAHVMGLSLGGAIAIDFALAHPARVRSLIAVATSAVGGYPWPPEIDQWFAGIGKAARGGDMATAKEMWLATAWFVPAMRQSGVAEKLRRIAADYSGWHLANRNPVRRPAIPANDRLGDIAAPTLLVTGGLDTPYYNLPLADRLAAVIPGARHIVFPDAGHMTNMEAPVAFNAAVLDFLSTLPAI